MEEEEKSSMRNKKWMRIMRSGRVEGPLEIGPELIMHYPLNKLVNKLALCARFFSGALEPRNLEIMITVTRKRTERRHEERKRE